MTSVEREKLEQDDFRKAQYRSSIEAFHKYIEKYRKYDLPKIASYGVRLLYGMIVIFYLAIWITRVIYENDAEVTWYVMIPPVHFLEFIATHWQATLTLYLIAPLILLIFNSLKDITDKLTETAAKITTPKETSVDKTARHLENILAKLNQDESFIHPPNELGDFRNSLISIGWEGDAEKLMLNFHDIPTLVYQAKLRLNTLISFIVAMVCLGPLVYFLNDSVVVKYISGTTLIAIYVVIFLLFLEARQKIKCLRFAIDATNALKGGSELLQNERDLGF